MIRFAQSFVKIGVGRADGPSPAGAHGRTLSCILSCLMLFFSLSASVSASLIILGDADFPPDGTVNLGYTQWVGQSFLSSSDADPKFVVSLQLGMTAVFTNQHFVIRIVREQGSLPNLNETMVEFDVTPLQEGNGSVVTLFPKDAYADIELQPDTLYWIVAGATASDSDAGEQGNGLYRWAYRDDYPEEMSVEGWSIGLNTAQAGSGGSGWTGQQESPYLFSLTLVPEPGTFLLLMGGLLMLWGVQHYAQKRTIFRTACFQGDQAVMQSDDRYFGAVEGIRQ